MYIERERAVRARTDAVIAPRCAQGPCEPAKRPPEVTRTRPTARANQVLTPWRRTLETENGTLETLRRRKWQDGSGKRKRTSVMPKRKNGENGETEKTGETDETTILSSTLKSSGRSFPFRKAIRSGTPLPAARGACTQRPALTWGIPRILLGGTV